MTTRRMAVYGTRPARGAALLLIVLVLAVAVGLAGVIRRLFTATASPCASDMIAPGVVHAAVPLGPNAGMDIIDVDLAASQYRPTIAISDIRSEHISVTGGALTPGDWLTRLNALAVVNGGYFGKTFGSRKEVVGLLAHKGRLEHASPPIRGTGGAFVGPGLYVRSAFGVTAKGDPQIVWAATPSRGGSGMYTYGAPIAPRTGTRWRIAQALGCGPTLIRAGRAVVTDHEERLVDGAHSARTFVAYDAARGRPRHFVMGVANAATYPELASALIAYFRQAHACAPSRAMCLDGGASSQLSYVARGQTLTPRATGVEVPTAVALVRM